MAWSGLGEKKNVVWDKIRFLMLNMVVFVMATTAWGAQFLFLLGICQHYFSWRLQSSVIL